ncbi:MAG: hypothetical protein PHO37_18940 [Kiritimatiellae bacterium]|nr:hypothetical protein [Kiritimatiellia bacterium]
MISTLAEAQAWLENRVPTMIRDCRRTMNDGKAAYPPQVGSGYKAFWLRDYAYILEGGAAYIPPSELLAAVSVFLNAQRSDGACVDCVKYDGTPIYKPGYGTMGENPVADGSQFTVAVIWLTWKQTGNASLLSVSVLDRLVRAMEAVPTNSVTGLVYIDPAKAWDRCSYGFTDSIRKKGDCLFTSLLAVEASRRLAEMLTVAGRASDAQIYIQRALGMTAQINTVLWDESAKLYRGASVACCEHDIWGSAFAVWLGVAPSERADAIAAVFKTNHSALTQKGQLRHTMPGIYWEIGCGRDTYQNGGFWGTPIGWYAYALNRVDPALADQVLVDLVNDFAIRGVGEWVFGGHVALPQGYMSSATLPLAGIRRLVRERGD